MRSTTSVDGSTGGPGGLQDAVFERLLGDRIVVLGSQVDDAVANQLAAQMLLLSAEDPKRDIHLYVNSPGGSVSAGMAVYDTMQFVDCDVAQGRVKVVVQASELRRFRQGRAAARSQHGRAVRRIEPPGHSDLGGRPVLTLQAGSHREGSGASPGPVSTISAGQTGHFRL